MREGILLLLVGIFVILPLLVLKATINTLETKYYIYTAISLKQKKDFSARGDFRIAKKQHFQVK